MTFFFFFFHLNLLEALSGSSYSRLLFKIAGNIQFCDLQPSFEYIYSFFSSNLSVKKLIIEMKKTLLAGVIMVLKIGTIKELEKIPVPDFY